MAAKIMKIILNSAKKYLIQLSNEMITVASFEPKPTQLHMETIYIGSMAIRYPANQDHIMTLLKETSRHLSKHLALFQFSVHHSIS